MTLEAERDPYSQWSFQDLFKEDCIVLDEVSVLPVQYEITNSLLPVSPGKGVCVWVVYILYVCMYVDIYLFSIHEQLYDIQQSLGHQKPIMSPGKECNSVNNWQSQSQSEECCCVCGICWSLWNSLPRHAAGSVDAFKSMLNSLLFSEHYGM